jgi:hypothetical protein
MTRQQHFWGTLPAPDVATAQALMIENSPDAALASVSDGELGDRANWVIDECGRRGGIPELLTLRKSRLGDDYPTMHPLRHPPIYSLRPRAEMPVEALNTGHADRARTGAAALTQRAGCNGDAPPALQISVPGPGDLAAFNWGPFMGRYYWAEVASLLREIRVIVAQQTGPGLIFQLEIPFPTYLVAKSPSTYQETMAVRLGRIIGKFIAQTPVGTVWILHTCDGDPHGKPIVSPTSVYPYVRLINAIYAYWPHETHRLDAVGMPMGNAAHPAPTGMDFYWALRLLAVPRSVRVIAGIAQVGGNHSLERQIRGLQTAEAAYGAQLVVAAPCGLGRRPESVTAVLTRQRALAQASTGASRWY